jgi:hypothetical protein
MPLSSSRAELHASGAASPRLTCAQRLATDGAGSRCSVCSCGSRRRSRSRPTPAVSASTRPSGPSRVVVRRSHRRCSGRRRGRRGARRASTRCRPRARRRRSLNLPLRTAAARRLGRLGRARRAPTPAPDGAPPAAGGTRVIPRPNAVPVPDQAAAALEGVPEEDEEAGATGPSAAQMERALPSESGPPPSAQAAEVVETGPARFIRGKSVPPFWIDRTWTTHRTRALTLPPLFFHRTGGANNPEKLAPLRPVADDGLVQQAGAEAALPGAAGPVLRVVLGAHLGVGRRACC